MTGNPLVSVITVTYNSASFVKDAVNSVLAQDYTHLEYLLADDCSTDDTWQIINSYQDPRIKAWKNETNLGEYANRNAALQKASGEYIIFIDGDDIIFPHGIAYFVKMMQSFPEAGMLVQKGYINNLLFPALFRPEETARNHFYGKTDLLTSSFTSNFFRTTVLKKYGLDSSYISGDSALRLRVAVNYPVLFVAGWVSWPRETPGQASSKLKDGIGLAEEYLFAKEIIDQQQHSLEPALAADLLLAMRKNLSRYVLHLLKKGKLPAAKKLMARTGLRAFSLLSYAKHQSPYTDPLKDHTPANPFRRNFLSNQTGK